MSTSILCRCCQSIFDLLALSPFKDGESTFHSTILRVMDCRQGVCIANSTATNLEYWHVGTALRDSAVAGCVICRSIWNSFSSDEQARACSYRRPSQINRCGFIGLYDRDRITTLVLLYEHEIDDTHHPFRGRVFSIIPKQGRPKPAVWENLAAHIDRFGTVVTCRTNQLQTY
jgi:hypothetical protein